MTSIPFNKDDLNIKCKTCNKDDNITYAGSLTNVKLRLNNFVHTIHLYHCDNCEIMFIQDLDDREKLLAAFGMKGDIHSAVLEYPIAPNAKR